jgi:hypothetical protein
MGMTILAQWVDVAQRVHAVRQHVRDLKIELIGDSKVDMRYTTECTRLASELFNVEQEIKYLYETLLQAQAALEYTDEWAAGSKK